MAGAGGAARRGAAWRCLDENRWWNGVPADAPGCDAAGPRLAEGVGCVLVLRRVRAGTCEDGVRQ